MAKVIQDLSVQEFLIHSSEFLHRDEAVHSMILGFCESLLSQKNPPYFEPVFLRVVEGTETKAVAVRMGMHLIISQAQETEIQELAQTVYQAKIQFPGVVGPMQESENFSKVWSQLSGRKSELGMQSKLYRLDTVLFPAGAEGRFENVSDRHQHQIAQWISEFAKDADLPQIEHPNSQQAQNYAQRVIQNQTTYFWTVGGEPVCMANTTRPTKNGLTVNAVYTPKPFRKKGYASALVAHLSQRILDSGKKFCLLYADQKNPTSNKIYQDIGYREISGIKTFIFSN